MIGMQTPSVARMEHRSAALARAERGNPLVDPAVDLLLDPVEEPRHEFLVMCRPQFLAGGERRLELQRVSDSISGLWHRATSA